MRMVDPSLVALDAPGTSRCGVRGLRQGETGATRQAPVLAALSPLRVHCVGRSGSQVAGPSLRCRLDSPRARGLAAVVRVQPVWANTIDESSGQVNATFDRSPARHT